MDFGWIEHKEDVFLTSTPSLEFKLPTKYTLYHVGVKDDSQSLSNILTKSPNDEIFKCFSGLSYTIYTNKDYTKIWSAGKNTYGECGASFNHMIKDYYYKPIDCFRINNIKICKICTNITGSCTFFISTDGKVYACGRNRRHQLGLNEVTAKHKFIPTLIPYLSNLIDVIDIKSNENYSVAIVKTHHPSIVTNWCRLYDVPSDLTMLLQSFTKTPNAVYSTTKHLGAGHPKFSEDLNEKQWNKIMRLNNHNIIKIAIGKYFSMFLEDNGKIWICGAWQDVAEYIPIQLKFFDEKGIKIKDIQCGSNLVLALDEKGNVWQWELERDTMYTSYWTSSNDPSNEPPTMINGLSNYNVDLIRCGTEHAYIKTKCGKYFVFGNSQEGEGILSAMDYYSTATRVDEYVKWACNASRIVDIFPGHFNTKVICESQMDFVFF